MRALILAAVLALAIVAPAQGSPRIEGAVPVSYAVSAHWSPSSRVLAGRSAIAVRNAGPVALRRVWVRLWPNGNRPRTQRCSRARARVTAVSGGRVGARRVTCSAMAIDLAPPLAPGARARFALRFAVHVPADEDVPGRTSGIDLLGEALPLVAVRDDRGLHLDPSPADGEAQYGLSAAWRLRLALPRGLDAVTTGSERHRHRRRGTVVTARVTQARDFAIAIGRLHTRVAHVGRTRVRVSAATPRLRRQLPAAMRRAAYSIRHLSSWYGRPGEREADVVLGTPSYSGQEFPGLVFTTPDQATVGHELGHQWFYSLVGNDQYDDPWLDESITVYNEVLLSHDPYPCNVRRPLGRAPVGLGTGMRYFARHPSAYEPTIYEAGRCALVRLERDIGRPALRRALRSYADTHRHGVGRTDDVLAAIHAAAPRYDVDGWARLVGLPNGPPLR